MTYKERKIKALENILAKGTMTKAELETTIQDNIQRREITAEEIEHITKELQ